MLCVNCDQPLPDGTDICPTCGTNRLELLASPVGGGSLRPRRRHRGLKAVGLLVCAAVLVALAGQAYQSYADASSQPEPKPGPKKAPAKAPAASPAPKPSPPSTPTPPTPTQDPTPVVQVHLGRVPSSVPDRDGAVAAVRAAMRDWAGEGVELREAADDDDADVKVRFAEDAADAGSRSGVAIVPLGDDGCGGEWTPYTQASVRALAARALGQAMGRSGPAGPGGLMDPNLRPQYEGGCSSAQGTLTIASGQADGKPFRLEHTATVAYTMGLQQGYADVCLLTPEAWDAFTVGEGGGEACHFAAQQESDAAMLGPGDYILGFRCVDASLSCQVDYTLSARAV